MPCIRSLNHGRPAMTLTETVTMRGRAVQIKEGDLLLMRSNTLWANLIATFNAGYSHVATAIAHEGRLVAFSVYRAPDGLVLEPVERFVSPQFTNVSVCRPRVARTVEQSIALRLAVAEIRREHKGDARRCYDGPNEFAHSLLHMQAATPGRYHCAELAARLVRAVGAWPEGKTVSVQIQTLAGRVGESERLF